jgi:hypothetical protein
MPYFYNIAKNLISPIVRGIKVAIKSQKLMKLDSSIYKWILVIVLVSISPFFYISFFNHPSADDFCSNIYALSKSYFEYLSFWYHAWTGRFGQISFMYIISKFDLLLSVKYLPPILILLHIHSTYLFIRVFFYNIFNGIQTIILSLIVCFLFYSLMPSLSQGIYWMASSTAYFISWILITYYIYFLFLQLNESLKAIGKVALIFLGVFIVGLNESALLYVVGLTGLSYIIYFKKINEHKYFFILLLFLFIFSIIAILAPGNFNRISSESIQNGYGTDPTLKKSIYHSSINSVIILFQYLKKYWSLLLFIVSLFQIVSFLNQKNASKNSTGSLKINWLFCLLVLSVPFPAYYATNYFQPRLGNLFLWILIISVILLYAVFQHSLQKIFAKGRYLLLITVIIFSGFFIVRDIIISNSNFKIVFFDLVRRRALNYDKELTLRYTLIQRRETKFTKLNSIPPSIFIGDITDDPKHWINGCVSKYFKIDSIQIIHE